jgi:hypothetical protein
MAPFVVLLILAVFGLDGELVRQPRSSRRSRTFCELQPDGRTLFRDPDGRLWKMETPRPNRTGM